MFRGDPYGADGEKMTKRGCGLAMDDAGDYRYTRRRRAITVAVSVVATVALCVGYAVADMCDVAPGVLTLRHVEHSTVAAAGRSIEAADGIAGGPNAEGAAALGRREPQLREGATPLVDALVTVCVVERDTFKPVSLRRTFPDLYAKYEDIVEEA